MSIKALHGDCLDVMRQLASEGLQADACVTDPPYHLVSIVKRFGAKNAAPAKGGKTGAYARASAGFMGQKWDGGDIAMRPETWRLVLDCLKPGAHLVAFAGTRTHHRIWCAIEDAGFEIRDTIAWLYGSGFPKSHNAGNGWGTALKPALEPICLARKPLIGTVAENVAAHGTGVINIDGCRIEGVVSQTTQGASSRIYGAGKGFCPDGQQLSQPHALGRWPANVIHDGSEEVLAAFPDAPGQQAPISETAPSGKTAHVYGPMKRKGEASQDRRYTGCGATNFAALPGDRRGDGGSAARFFYSAKADATDRCGSKHPTVKPLDLMRWLCRLVTPAGGLILDPFAGSGTTGEAAQREGFRAVLIEREAEYFADIQRRLGRVSGADTPLFACDVA